MVLLSERHRSQKSITGHRFIEYSTPKMVGSPSAQDIHVSVPPSEKKSHVEVNRCGRGNEIMSRELRCSRVSCLPGSESHDPLVICVRTTLKDKGKNRKVLIGWSNSLLKNFAEVNRILYWIEQHSFPRPPLKSKFLCTLYIQSSCHSV